MTPRDRRKLEFQHVADKHGVCIHDVFSKNRRAPVVRAKREIAKTLRSRQLGWTEIGTIMGCDHSSAIYLCNSENRRAVKV